MRIEHQRIVAHCYPIVVFFDRLDLSDILKLLLELLRHPPQIVVSFDQHFISLELIEKFKPVVFCFPAKVADDVNGITAGNDRIPAADQFGIHFFYASKRPIVESNHVLMAEVEV